MAMSRAEVITSIDRRRRWSRVDKERLVAASFEPDVSVSEVARAAGLHSSQLFRWRKELCKREDATVAPLVPVTVIPSSPSTEAGEASLPTTPARRHKGQSIIEIVLGDGRCVRVDCDVDGNALRRVLDALVRR